MGYNVLKCSCGAKYYLPQRYIVAIMTLISILVGYGHRVSLSIAITAMTDKLVSTSTSCPPRNSSLTSLEPKNISGGVINWTNREQNLILSSFYPGYIIGHVPAGILSDKYGARWVFFGGMFLSTITVVLTPVIVVHTPWWVTYILRNIMGFGQCVIYPAISVLFAKWIPGEERSLLGAFSFAANSLGIIFGNFCTGMIIDALGNWPTCFYIWGGLGALWCLFVIIYVFSEPVTHPFITDQEFDKLEEKIPQSDHKLKIPWVAFFKDTGVWAIIVSEIGHDFTVFTLANNYPKYLSDVLHYDLTENAVASSVPYLAQWIGGMIFGQISNYIIKRVAYSTLWCRRIMTTLGCTVPALFVLFAGYMGCDGNWVITMFAINLFFKGAVYCSMKINHLDLSINFAGILMALTNGIGAISGFVSPMLINLLAPNNTLQEWQIVYWGVFLFALITNVFYVFFCKADRQKWDVGPGEMADFLALKEEEKADKEERKAEKRERKAARKKASFASSASARS